MLKVITHQVKNFLHHEGSTSNGALLLLDRQASRAVQTHIGHVEAARLFLGLPLPNAAILSAAIAALVGAAKMLVTPSSNVLPRYELNRAPLFRDFQAA